MYIVTISNKYQMSIAKRPSRNTNQNSEAAAEEFISGADQSEKTSRRNKVMTTMRFDPELLERIDAAAKKRGISRSAWINYTLSKAIEEEG
jgi:predicted HicB family RNase H-like nuclease